MQLPKACRSPHNRKSPSSTSQGNIVWLVIPVFLVLVFSFNFHVLWLIYDFVALLLIVHFLFSLRRRVSVFQVAVLALVLGYFMINVMRSGQAFMGVLSIWDTFKHLSYVVLFIGFLKYQTQLRIDEFAKSVYKICFISYLIQAVVVIVQYKAGVFYDDIAGTFGDGGSHAIAYISVLFLVGLIVHGHRGVVVLAAVFFTFVINVLSENAGYLLLMLAVLMGLFMAHFSVRELSSGRNILFVAIALMGAYWMSVATMYSELSLSSIVIGRFIDVFAINDNVDAQAVGRGVSLVLASDLGGWFGRGPGAYSIIYQFEGYDFDSVYGLQIAISELTHLISESGFVGYFLTVAVYLAFIKELFRGGRYKFVGMALFVVCTVYSKVLMNESQFFLFLLLMFYFAAVERKQSA